MSALIFPICTSTGHPWPCPKTLSIISVTCSIRKTNVSLALCLLCISQNAVAQKYHFYSDGRSVTASRLALPVCIYQFPAVLPSMLFLSFIFLLTNFLAVIILVIDLCHIYSHFLPSSSFLSKILLSSPVACLYVGISDVHSQMSSLAITLPYFLVSTGV